MAGKKFQGPRVPRRPPAPGEFRRIKHLSRAFSYNRAARSRGSIMTAMTQRSSGSLVHCPGTCADCAGAAGLRRPGGRSAPLRSLNCWWSCRSSPCSSRSCCRRWGRPGQTLPRRSAPPASAACARASWSISPSSTTPFPGTASSSPSPAATILPRTPASATATPMSRIGTCPTACSGTNSTTTPRRTSATRTPRTAWSAAGPIAKYPCNAIRKPASFP